MTIVNQGARPRALSSKLVGSALLLWSFSILVFLLPRLTGQDTVRAIIRSRTADLSPDQAAVERFAAELSLDRPIWVQYLTFVKQLATGDLGLSYTSRIPVAPRIVQALSVSAQLVVSALVIASVLGLVVGVWCASKPNSAPDRILTAASRLAVSVPEFISGPLLVLVFAVTLHALPATGWGTLDQAVLPVMTVALLPTAVFVQVTRAEASKVSAQQWVSTIRASGLSEGRVLRQVLRNSMTPVIGLMSLFLPGLIGGAVIVEVIFSIPGRGRLLYTAVLDSDLPLAQAGLMVLLALAVISTIASDLARRVIDPRLRR